MGDATCLRCGEPLLAVYCKIVCPRCGYREDCSDAVLLGTRLDEQNQTGEQAAPESNKPQS